MRLRLTRNPTVCYWGLTPPATGAAFPPPQCPLASSSIIKQRRNLPEGAYAMAMTRRSLLNGMARLGGAGAVYETLSIWEFLKPVPAVAASLTLPADAGKGKTVSVLGAGVSGLCAAYELDRAGFDVV